MEQKEQKDINELIAGYLTGQMSDEQLDALHVWIKADKSPFGDKGNKRYFDDMRELWLAAPMAFPVQQFNKDAAYRLFLSRTQKKTGEMGKNGEMGKMGKTTTPSQLHIWFLRVAAAVLIGFLAGTFYMRHTHQTKNSLQVASQYDVIVPHGSRSQVFLADGTQVWLNAGSRLRYATDFGQTAREVHLEGEAFFDVARDTTKLFVVKTDKLDVKALGTSFNVKAYPDEEKIETVLISGKISISDATLAPNEKHVYSRKNNKILIETTKDATVYTSWKDDLWRIESETLGSFAVKLERRYDVKIRFADRATQALSITAAIKNESLEQVLRFLQLTAPIDFTIDGKTVVLKENKYLKEKYRNYYKQR